APRRRSRYGAVPGGSAARRRGARSHPAAPGTGMSDAFIGTDIGGTKTSAVLCDAAGTPLAHAWIAHDPQEHQSITERLTRCIREVTAVSPGRTVRAVGVAVAGLV